MNKTRKISKEITWVLVEIPKGSRNKFEIIKGTDQFFLDRVLSSSMVYPEDYGFIPETIGLDGDPLDVLCLVSEPTFTGCRIQARVIGILKMIDQGEVDDKIIVVSANDPFFANISEISDLSNAKLSEISNFFTRYKELEKKQVSIEGFLSKEAALLIINQSRERFLQTKPAKSFANQTNEK